MSNANYEVRAPDPERIRIVDAPGLPGRKAVRLLAWPALSELETVA